VTARQVCCRPAGACRRGRQLLRRRPVAPRDVADAGDSDCSARPPATGTARDP
jgi:hypothetical protein